MKLKRFLSISVFIFIGAIQIFGQQSPLREKRITIQRENESLGTIFRDLIEKYDVPIGFEESSLDAKHSDYLFEVNLPVTGNEGFKSYSCTRADTGMVCPQRNFKAKDIKFTLNVENESLETVLNLIVSKMNNYKWEIIDEVVNIIPIAGRDPILEEFLNVKIKNFSVVQSSAGNGDGKRTISEIRLSILNTPELFDFRRGHNLVVSSTRYMSPNLTWSIPQEMNFSNLTLIELLNKITKIKRGGWAIRMSDFFERGNSGAIDIDI